MTDLAGRMGQHPRPTHVIVHLSDLHLLSGGQLLFGAVDTEGQLQRALTQLETSGIRPDAIVVSGDIADRGEPDAYRRARRAVDATANRLGAPVVWVMGNHDKREVFHAELLDQPADREPVDGVIEVNGLRIISLDSSVPGFHHGELKPAQLEFLARTLRSPARFGTIIAMHHPPVPTPVAVLDILELADQHLFADTIKNTDVRAILAGHVHYTTAGNCAGIPVFVAGATSYTMDLSAPIDELHGIDGGQSFSLVHVHDDQVVHSAVPLGNFRQVSGIGADFLASMRNLNADGRRDAFSRMPTDDQGEDDVAPSDDAPSEDAPSEDGPSDESAPSE